jgi:putative transposase
MSMKLVRTIKLRLNENTQVFQPTIDAYTKAFNYTCNIGYNTKDFNGVSLHNKVYSATRTYLPSQLACSARMKATEALKSVKKLQEKELKLAKWKEREPKIFSCPESRQTSIRYDARSYNVWFDRNEVSLSTIEDRKTVKIDVPEYFRQYLSWRRCSADLFIRDDKVFLNIVFETEINDPVSNGKFIGIDRGINKIAVTSHKRFFGGGKVKQVSRRYKRLRTLLQQKKHSGKRHLAKIKRKENRFRRDVNHCISKQIVNSLEAGTTIVLEKLTNINQLVKNKRRKTEKDKEQRREYSSWAYFQLEQFIIYKAAFRGIRVDYVDARYTSQKCSKCSHVARSNRKKQSIFKCCSCGYQLNADLNASFNIVLNYQDAISHPNRAFQGASCSQPSMVA